MDLGSIARRLVGRMASCMQSIIPVKYLFVKSVLEKFAGDVDSEGFGRRIPVSMPGMMEYGSVGVWPLVEQSQTAW
jgi:hypothetical protein